MRRYIILFLTVALLFCMWVDAEMCAYRFLDWHIESRYHLWYGCQVHDGEKWVNDEEYL